MPHPPHQVIFVSAPTGKINGGIKQMFRHAEQLQKLGYAVAVYERDQKRPAWFASSVPLVGDNIFDEVKNKTFVLPEDQPEVLEQMLEWDADKIIYAQNHYYAALGLGPNRRSFADYKVRAILCAGDTIRRYCQMRHEAIPAYTVPCGIDRAMFAPKLKKNIIAFFPRKRPLEAIFMQDLFKHLYPHWRHWEWKAIDNAHERDAAAVLGEARVFLSLARLDGFGLTALEAMSAGCVVAGFTGNGGRDYATPNNGFWAEEDNPEDGVKQLGAAMALVEAGEAAVAKYQASCATTLKRYSPEAFAASIEKYWGQLLPKQPYSHYG